MLILRHSSPQMFTCTVCGTAYDDENYYVISAAGGDIALCQDCMIRLRDQLNGLKEE